METEKVGEIIRTSSRGSDGMKYVLDLINFLVKLNIGDCKRLCVDGIFSSLLFYWFLLDEVCGSVMIIAFLHVR